jgi:hypothetical protein
MSQAFPPLSPEYDSFLYAIVCNDKNGMYLTMASVIARSGADPWKEAARLSTLQRDSALNVMARLLEEHDCAEHISSQKQRLVQLLSLLPKPKPLLATIIKDSTQVRGAPIKIAGVTVMAGLCIFAIAAYLFIAMLRLDPPGQTQKPGDSSPVETQK